MSKLPKERIQKLKNSDLAELTGIEVKDIETAQSKLTELVAIAKNTENPARSIRLALDEVGIDRLDPETAAGLVEMGPIEVGLGEVAGAPGIGFATLRKMIPALTKIELPGAGESRLSRRIRSAHNHVDPNIQLMTLSHLALNTIANVPPLFIGDGFLEDLEEITEDLETITDFGKQAKDTLKAAKDLYDELKRHKKEFERGGKTSTLSGPGTGGPNTNPVTPEELNGELTEDKYGEIFGEALDDEPIYTVWLDRLMAFEVDGIGDDNTYLTFQVQAFLKDPAKRVSTSFVTNVMNINEREEYRLKPRKPINGLRALPMDEDDWKIRNYLEERDAALALRVGGTVRGIPLSKLRKLMITYYLYESDSVDQLTALVAELGAAAVAAFAVIKGGFAPQPGSTAELSAALRRALKKLNELINSDDKLLFGSFTYKPRHFRDAFRNGQTFKVRSHDSLAACGRLYQRDGGGEMENDDILDFESAYDFFEDNSDDLEDPDFWEDNFESYYELRLRFEKEEPDSGD